MSSGRRDICIRVPVILSLPALPMRRLMKSQRRMMETQGHSTWITMSRDTDTNHGERSFRRPSKAISHTVLWLIKQMECNGGSPKLWLDLWSRSRGIAETDRVKHELRCRLFELAFTGMHGTLSRRIQSIVDAYSGAAGASPDWMNAKVFTGYQSSEDVVAPQLKTWAARRGKEELEPRPGEAGKSRSTSASSKPAP